MNILFIYPNMNAWYEDVFSFGLASIVSVTRKNGHNCKLIIVYSKNDYPKIFSEIETFKPKVVGFSSVSSQFRFVSEIAAGIKSRDPSIITVCGGVHPTIYPECVLESKFLDGIFVGESDYAFIEFLEKIEKKRNFKDTENFAFVDNGKFIQNKLKPLISVLDDLPFPDREITPFDKTLRNCGFAPFLLSRGCPFNCTYCSNAAIASKYNIARNFPRYRSPESSIREIEQTLERFPIKTVFFNDDNFGLNIIWRKEFCKKYKERIGIKFIALLRPNVVSEEYIALLKDAGCYRVSMSIESGNEYIRNQVMKRGMSEKQIIDAFRLADKYELETNTENIIGIPQENEEMIWDSIKLNRKIKPTSSNVSIYYPYKGTELGNYCFENRLVDEALYLNSSVKFLERFDTVLSYSKEKVRSITYFKRNWESLVYSYGPLRRLKVALRKTFIWELLHAMKRMLIYEYRRMTF